MEQPPNVSNEKTPPATEEISARCAETTELEGRVIALERGLRPTGQIEFAVQAAENEGMPTRPVAVPVARRRRPAANRNIPAGAPEIRRASAPPPTAKPPTAKD